MRLLLLSNGHGEDAIAAQLAGPLRDRGFDLTGLPIVGEGRAYRDAGVPVDGPTAAMPSGGFIYGRPKALAGDLANGLAALTIAQLRWLRAGRGRWDAALAIGDVVPLAFAWWLGAPYLFVGCAKSDLYRGGRPGAYEPHERWLMRRPRCRGVFPRDEVTTRNLVAAGVAADWLGNPMMDGLAPGPGAPARRPDAATLLILPGSRREAPGNFRTLHRAAAAIAEGAPRPVRVLAALAPGTDPADFPTGDGPAVDFHIGALGDAAGAADLALAMAGTATEQVVGLGVPALTVPGPGPQFTPAFAAAQARLLGEAVALCPDDPGQIAAAAWSILADPARHARMATEGRHRLGPPGGSIRIAQAVADRLGAYV